MKLNNPEHWRERPAAVSRLLLGVLVKYFSSYSNVTPWGRSHAETSPWGRRESKAMPEPRSRLAVRWENKALLNHAPCLRLTRRKLRWRIKSVETPS